MKVLGIVSSPRKAGNSELAVKEILMRLPESWEREMIRLNELDLEYCTACYSCIPADKKCRLNDDLEFFLEHVRRSDKIVIGAPAYYLGGHTAMKVTLDRFLSIVNNYDDFKGKDCVFIGSYGRPGSDGLLKENMVIFARKLHLDIVDSQIILTANPGDSVQGDNLRALHRLAASIENPPEKPYQTDGEITCPYCTSRAITLMEDGSWKCTVCHGVGTIENKDGKYGLDYDPNNKDYNFSLEDFKSHADYLAKMKQLFLDTRHKIKELQAKYADVDFWVRPEKSA
ncbi:MAG: flavodoxin family protein [Spirochaetia bacterium]|jgi:multimeric flavodoxin WrbA|nr:flavodoxin family protein [Spirochaetia bacterium]